MSIFNIPISARVSITTDIVEVCLMDLNAKGMMKTNVTYDATATADYRDWPDGTRRRRFIDCSVDFGCGREIWLTDGPTVLNTVSGDSWPDVVEDLVSE